MKYLVFLTLLNLNIAGYWCDKHGWKVLNDDDTSAADDTLHANDRSKRQVYDPPIYTIELLMVIDFSLYQFWEERVREKGNSNGSPVTPEDVKNKIRKFYASIGEAVNFRFQNISVADFGIRVEVVEIFIADTNETSYWTEMNKNSSNEVKRYVEVEGSRSLEFFNDWIKAKGTNLTRHDHAMLFTRYNIQYLSNSLVSGLDYGRTMCGPNSVSFVEDHFNSIAATTAARLLGHSLGAIDDSDDIQCSSQDNYIMSPINFSGQNGTSLNPWHFSSCSVEEFRTFLRSLNSSCLQSDDAAAITDVPALPGSEYSVDDQCRFIINNSSFFCLINYRGNFSNICTDMQCYDSAEDACAHVLPGNGLSCGSGKWCVNGRCVESPYAPNNTDACLFGDAASSCSVRVPSDLPKCYDESNYLVCCDTCNRNNNSIPGCEFGDRGNCNSVVDVSACADETTRNLCCLTCARLVPNCSAGTYLPSPYSSCMDCPPGMYQSQGNQTSCLPCNPGTYQNSTRQTLCNYCPSGTYQTESYATSCITCKPGRYQPTIGTSTECSLCQPGTYQDSYGNTFCWACPAGRYQPLEGTSFCLPCEVGTYQANNGSTSCMPCAEGTYQYEIGSLFCFKCDAGNYQPNTKSSACLACGAGYYQSSIGATSCIPCSVGTYQSKAGQASCVSCPTWETTVMEGSQSIEDCHTVNNCTPGTYQSSPGSACILCPAGRYQPRPGQTICIQCQTGTHQPNIASTECLQCPPGSYQNETGSTSCVLCEVGTYQPDPGKSACIACPSGKYQGQKGSTSCALCEVGNYQPDPGKSACIACPIGNYQGQKNSTSCVLCEVGTYQPDAGKSACIACPSGNYQMKKGSTNCVLCEVGTYQPDPGKSACIACPSGNYQGQKGSKSCVLCEVGTYQPDPGKSACIACPSGNYQGQKGSTSCPLCEVGNYQPDPGKSACIACPSGNYQGQKGSTICALCEVGNYQPDPGKSACIACPAGRYQGQKGSTSCALCEVGTYQPDIGKSACIPCQEGSYNSISGDASCRPCENGTFQNSTGQSFCFPCPNKYTTEKEGQQSVRACFQGYCPEYKYTIYNSTSEISVTIPSTKINQTGYSWNRCKNDSSKALLSAFCQAISRTEVKWTRVQEECDPEPQDQTSPISAQLHTFSQMDVNDTNLINVLQETNALIKLKKSLTPLDVGYLADILGKVNTVDNVPKEVLNATLDTVNTLLESNSSTIQSVQESPGAANRILKIIEDITNKVEGDTVENPVRTIKKYIALAVWEQIGNTLIGIQLLQGNTDDIQNNSVIQLRQEPQDTELLDAAIYFQSDLLNGTKNKLGMAIIWNDVLFKSGSDRYKVVSRIMAAKLIRNGASITHLDDKYVKAVFLPTEEDSRIVCGYWDYTLNQNGGGWAFDGCNRTMENKRYICTCNHLTNFAVLVDLDANTIPPEHEQALEILTYVGLILSIIGLSLTILTFLCFRHLRRGRGQQTLFCLCIPILCYSIIFLVGIKRTEHYAPCIVVSVLIHYFILAAFMWMLMEGVLQYLRFVKVLGTYIPNFLIKTSVPAWGMPLVPIIVLLAYDYNLYYGGLGFCWMKLGALYYAFVLPVGLIILVNAVIFTIVTFRIFRRPKELKINQSERKMAILNFQAAVSVFVVLGLTWIFGVVALGGVKLTFQYIFVFLNAFQGFFIFLLFTAREKQVRDQWIRFCCRRPTGYFTSYERKSSSQDTFATTMSGRKLSSSSNSLTDNRECKPGSSSQVPIRRSSVSQEQIQQDHVKGNSLAQQFEQNRRLSYSVEKERTFSSLQEEKKAESSSGKYIKTSKGNKYKSSNKDDARELKKKNGRRESDVTTDGKHLFKSTPDHTGSKYNLADTHVRNRGMVIKGAHLSRSTPDEASSNHKLFNSPVIKYTSPYLDNIQGGKVRFALGRSMGDKHDPQKRGHITRFSDDGAYF